MNLGYEIRFSLRAAGDIKKLARADRKKLLSVSKHIDSLSSNPFLGKTLKGSLKGVNSLRCGDIRIIYEILPAEKITLVVRIGHRKEVYR